MESACPSASASGGIMSIMSTALSRIHPVMKYMNLGLCAMTRHLLRKALSCLSSLAALAASASASTSFSLGPSSGSSSAMAKLSQSTARKRLRMMHAPKSTATTK